MEVTRSILKEITGGTAFLDWMETSYEGNLDFADSEVVELLLRRSRSSILTLKVQQLRSDASNFAMVRLHLKDMIDVSLEGFLNQNVIGGMKIRKAETHYVHPSLVGYGAIIAEHLIILEPCAGAFGQIKATIEKIELQETQI